MYDAEFYATTRDGMIGSARALVPILLDGAMGEVEAPLRVIDVGCGEGWWALQFQEEGCDVVGLDGGWHGRHRLGDRFIPHDLHDPLPEHLHGRFDVVVCLEVAEHLREPRARTFIGDLCALVGHDHGWVVFSAAIPGQGGTGHLNEQWPDYWATLFNLHEFVVDDSLRLDIWTDDRIENWYRQNLLIASPAHSMVGHSFGPPPLRLVHPVLYEARRRR